MIYLDNSATTKPFPEVVQSFQKVAEQYYANPSSIHRFGSEAERLLLQSKKQAAQLLKVSPEEVIFTSGGTEGNNIAIKGIALEHQNRGKHIITSQIEHPSVIQACGALESLGFEVTYLPVTETGSVRIDDIKASIRPDTILISIMSVNNELGTVQPIGEIGHVVKQYPKIFFHVDHVQGLGKVDIDFYDCGIDLCTMSGHKIHGLNGTGALFVKKGTTLFPLHHGGGQEGAYRAGTENLAGNVSFVKALRMIMEQKQTAVKKLETLNQRLRERLAAIPYVIINSPTDAAAHIVNISVPGFKPEVIIHALGENDIYISTMSACSSKRSDESAVLAACRLREDRTTSALRVSMSFENTQEDVDTFVSELKKVLMELNKVMG
ncbi:cysteine desulfurase [Thalassobacillus cyri]|uniref:Cysteine desulfurase n=1 Tax=Thalassobacillus cyri TaxID=571932 RepID=A0A1H4BJ57_9BACI|nr:cysteine desulfurase family protein [Thalassobacillus cyri]SEA48146.1 cysteine desulfurase [Thalassobacillus cyri]